MNGFNPNKLSYEFFNRGSPKEGRRCEQWFLDALISDLTGWSFRLVIRLPHTATPNTILGREAIIAAQNVFFVMNECRRLRSALEIFPSDAARKEFFKQLSLISKAMRELKEAHLWMDMDPVAWQKSLYNSWTWTELHRNRSDFFFPESLTGRVPFWHPLNIGQNIWNKWLENRCRYEIPGTENKIIQRLPDLALRISHRTKFMYNIVERSYEQASRVIRDWPSDRHELSAATGENHEIQDSIIGLRWEIKELGRLPIGGYMRKDVNGVISLESISLAITRMYRRQVPPLERRALVCVLFRD